MHSVTQTLNAPVGLALDDEIPSPASLAKKDGTEISNRILDIIFEYSLNKFNDSVKQRLAGRPKFLSVIDQFITAGTRVEMCLPAFPFKSANKVEKVFGILPDKAEELALERLDTMCRRIGDVYAPGARLTVISDGIVYNDLLGISDRDTWAYGEALRMMAVQKGFNKIDFSRLKDLVSFPLPDKLQEVTYVANAFNFRRSVFNNYGKDDLDIDHEIATKPDTQLTYLGYRRFLESDLRYIFPLGKGRTSNGYKRDVKYLAKQMLIRGYAYAGAVKAAFPNHLRLSIHQSTGEHKVSMSLLNTKTGFTTPWHCEVALMADGEWISGTMIDFKKNPLLEIVYEDGRPSYFREKTSQPVNGEKVVSTQQVLNRVNGHSVGPWTLPESAIEKHVEIVQEKLQYQPNDLPAELVCNPDPVVEKPMEAVTEKLEKHLNGHSADTIYDTEPAIEKLENQPNGHSIDTTYDTKPIVEKPSNMAQENTQHQQNGYINSNGYSTEQAAEKPAEVSKEHPQIQLNGHIADPVVSTNSAVERPTESGDEKNKAQPNGYHVELAEPAAERSLGIEQGKFQDQPNGYAGQPCDQFGRCC